MAVARPNGYKIDFVRNPISGSAAWFLFLSLNSFLNPFLKSKFMKKNFINQHKPNIFLWSKSQDRQLRQYLTPPAWELSFCQKFKVTKVTKCHKTSIPSLYVEILFHSGFTNVKIWETSPSECQLFEFQSQVKIIILCLENNWLYSQNTKWRKFCSLNF